MDPVADDKISVDRDVEAPSLVLASRNQKKCIEIVDLLAKYSIEIVSVSAFADAPEVIEDGQSFSDNAIKKATETAKFLSRWVLAEDSGLMVDALDGAPGIYSARFSGDNATDATNNETLMAELQTVPIERRTARYVCHVAVADPAGVIRLQVEATCRGRITTEAWGTNGFGYDPYFQIPEYHCTFGELSPLVKQQLSHRSRAFAQLTPQLVKLFREAIPDGNHGP